MENVAVVAENKLSNGGVQALLIGALDKQHGRVSHWQLRRLIVRGDGSDRGIQANTPSIDPRDGLTYTLMVRAQGNSRRSRLICPERNKQTIRFKFDAWHARVTRRVGQARYIVPLRTEPTQNQRDSRSRKAIERGKREWLKQLAAENWNWKFQ